jgi:hypothetical protein
LILAIQREEDKVRHSLKDAAKKGDKGVCTILAKEIIRARKAITKIHTSKAHLNSIQLQMKNQLGEDRSLLLHSFLRISVYQFHFCYVLVKPVEMTGVCIVRMFTSGHFIVF